jgi:hypothetical protein
MFKKLQLKLDFEEVKQLEKSALEMNVELERINYHLQEIICVLKDELIHKDQIIRKIKSQTNRYGILERMLTKVEDFSGKMKIALKKLFGLY